VQRALDGCNGLELDIYTSNESMDLHAEYIRDGLEFGRWYENMIRLLESRQLRGLHVMCTINALCLESLPEFLTMLMGLKKLYGRNSLSFTLNILRFPSFQSALILDASTRQYHSQRLRDFLDSNQDSDLLHEHEINHVRRLIDYLTNVESPHSQSVDIQSLRNDFHKFYQQYDVRRGKDFRTTFSRLRDWYDSLC
jgi:hypothetical protein